MGTAPTVSQQSDLKHNAAIPGVAHNQGFKPRNTDSKVSTPSSSEPLPPFRSSKLIIPLLLIVVAFMIPVFVTMSRFKVPAQRFNVDLYNRINKLWFADLPAIPNEAGFKASLKKWYGLEASDDEKLSLDKQCTEICRSVLESIGPAQYALPAADGSYQGELNQASTIARPFVEELESVAATQGLANSSTTALSMIILLDQMPRNIYRDNQGVVYTHYDRISRSLLRHILNSPERLDRHPHIRRSFAQRSFFYMPLMHSEFLEDHNLWEKLVAEEMRSEAKGIGDQASSWFLDNSVKFGKTHRDILEKFGRYPYRNRWVDRETTKEEKEWIEKGGETFGSQ